MTTTRAMTFRRSCGTSFLSFLPRPTPMATRLRIICLGTSAWSPARATFTSYDPSADWYFVERS